MKNLTLVLLLTCPALAAWAQPTFTSAGIPPVGTVITSYEVNPTGVSQGPSGPGQAWNFSSATTTGLSNNVTIVDKVTTPFGVSFPAANLVTATLSSMGNQAYAYFLYNASLIDLLGFGIQSTPDIVLTYANHRTVMIFPFTYNSAFMDTYTGFASYTVSGITVNQYRSGTLTVLGDAWGTLTTPGGGPYSGCLRVKQAEVVVDSVVYVGIPGSFITTDRITTYSWSKNNAIENLFSIIYDTLDAGGSFSYNKTVAYGDQLTGIAPSAAPGKPLAVYPNPAGPVPFVFLQADALNPGPATFVMTDAGGREVKRLAFALADANHKSVAVEVADLPAGLYLVRVEQAGARLTTKFVKQ